MANRHDPDAPPQKPSKTEDAPLPDRIGGMGFGDTSAGGPEAKREKLSNQEHGHEGDFLKRIAQEGPGDLLDVWLRDELASSTPRDTVVKAIRDRLGMVRGPGYVVGEPETVRPEDRFKPEHQQAHQAAKDAEKVRLENEKPGRTDTERTTGEKAAADKAVAEKAAADKRSRPGRDE